MSLDDRLLADIGLSRDKLKRRLVKTEQTSSDNNRFDAAGIVERDEQETSNKYRIISQNAYLLKDVGLDRYLDRKKLDDLQWICYPIF